MKKRLPLWVPIVTFLLITASACRPLSTVSQPGRDESTPGVEEPAPVVDDFPLEPDPVNVSATLDEARAVVYRRGSYLPWLDGEDAGGAKFSLDLGWFFPLEMGEDGTLLPAYEADITMTPVLAIEGLPFSQGFLAAVHLGPEGILSTEEGYLRMEIPGDDDPSELIGFAADGTGEDFHLFPASISSYDGTIYAEFSIMHFSIYGVARALQSEIEAQTARPPSSPASQDDQELAPLVKIPEDDLAPLMNKIQMQLNKSYDRMVKKNMTNLQNIPCKGVDVVALEFNRWAAKVQAAGQTGFFETKIRQDQRALYDRLMACISEVCTTCLHPQDGVAPDPAKVGSMTVLIDFAKGYASALNLGDEITNYLWRLNYECSRNAGLPLPSEGIAADGGTGSGGELACP